MCGVTCSLEMTSARRGVRLRGGRASAMALRYSARRPVDIGEGAPEAVERRVDDGAPPALDPPRAEALEHRGGQGPGAQAYGGDDHRRQDRGARVAGRHPE